MHRRTIALLILAFHFVHPSVAQDPPFAHMVFFTLADERDETRSALVAACKEHLDGHEGTLYFSVGTIADEMKRDVNDREFGVALHMVFRDKAAHDTYQTHPRHLKFIEENKNLWSSVRVFDSRLALSPTESLLRRSVDFSIAQDSMHETLRRLGAEAQRDLEGEVVAIRIDAKSLQFDGITQNQQIRNLRLTGKSVADALNAIVRQGNPRRGARLDSREQRLVWVVIGDEIVITTRDGAAKVGAVLPEVFQIGE